MPERPPAAGAKLTRGHELDHTPAQPELPGLVDSSGPAAGDPSDPPPTGARDPPGGVDAPEPAMTRPLRLLHEGGSFFESPRWHDGAWWVSDFYNHRVLRIDDAGRATTVCEVEGRPSGLGWLPDGDLLVASMVDHLLLRVHEGAPVVHADLAAFCRAPLNDLVVDRAGHAYTADFGFDLMAAADPEPTSLLRVDPDGRVHIAAADMLFPNGAVITADGRQLIVGETVGCRYSVFDLGADGALSGRRVWAQLAPTPHLGSYAETLPEVVVAPDGCCLDASGAIWMADAVGGRVLRVREGGKILEEIAAPDGLGAFACMLGGSDGHTLLICAAPDFLEARRCGRNDAVLLATEVAVPHAGLP